MYLNAKNAPLAKSAAAGKVIIHAKPIGFIIAHLALWLYKPMPSTAPMSMCVELTGIPNCVASKMMILAPSSALKPVVGRISASFEPTVAMTSLPKNQSPATKDTPNISITANGTGALGLIPPLLKTSKIAAKGPSALAMSFAPCEKAKLEAVKI